MGELFRKRIGIITQVTQQVTHLYRVFPVFFLMIDADQADRCITLKPGARQQFNIEAL